MPFWLVTQMEIGKLSWCDPVLRPFSTSNSRFFFDKDRYLTFLLVFPWASVMVTRFLRARMKWNLTVKDLN